MSYSILGFVSIVVVLLLTLGWLSFSKLRREPETSLILRQERERPHISYLPYIKQALANGDLEFLKARGSPEFAKRVQRERQRIALTYLSDLREDFDKLLQFARVIAVMSPGVEAIRELQGLRLRVEFSYRYYLIYLGLFCGTAPAKAIGNLSDMVSALTVRMETAISELGKRAVLGSELPS